MGDNVVRFHKIWLVIFLNNNKERSVDYIDFTRN